MTSHPAPVIGLESDDMGAAPGPNQPVGHPRSVDQVDMQCFEAFNIYGERIQACPSFNQFMTLTKRVQDGDSVFTEHMQAVTTFRVDLDRLMPQAQAPVETRQMALRFAYKGHPATHKLTGVNATTILKCLDHMAAAEYPKAIITASDILWVPSVAAAGPPPQAPPVESTVRSQQKDYTDENAQQALDKLEISPVEDMRQVGYALWELRCELGRVANTPRLLAEMFRRLVAPALGTVSGLPPPHELPTTNFTVAEAQAQLDAWVKDVIVPGVDYKTLPYMTNTWPFFRPLPDEGNISLWTRVAKAREMRQWAHEIFGFNSEQIEMLEVINMLEHDAERQKQALDGFFLHKKRTVKDMSEYLVSTQAHHGCRGKTYPPRMLGCAVQTFPSVSGPLAVNAVKLKLDDKNFEHEDTTSKRSKTGAGNNAAAPRGGGGHSQNAAPAVMRQVTCKRCGKQNHEALDCLLVLPPDRPNKCGKCSSTAHTTAACNVTDLSCRRCDSKSHRDSCCPETIGKAVILLGNRAAPEYKTRILRADPKGGFIKINAVTTEATRTHADELLAELLLEHGVDPKDVNTIDTLPPTLHQINSTSLNALASGLALTPEVCSRIDGPISLPLEYASIEFQNNVCASQNYTTQGLCDSGATVCAISLACVRTLLTKKVVNPHDIHILKTVTVTVANNNVVDCPGLLLATISSSDRTYRGGFIIMPNLPYDLLIGQPGLFKLFDHQGFTAKGVEQQRVLSLDVCNTQCHEEDEEVTEHVSRMPSPIVTLAEHEEGRAPWIQEIYEGTTRRLQVNFPLMQRADVEPHVEPPRRTSKNEERTIQVLVDHMVREGQILKIPSSEAVITLPIALIDKLAHETPRPPPIIDMALQAEIVTRYRFCIDARITNQLELHERDGKLKYVAPRTADLKNSPAHAPYQYQTGAYELLSRMPAKVQYFARVDIKNAFYGVRLHPDLCRLFCFEVHNWDNGTSATYMMRVLPQGWRWSPLFFRKVSQFIVEKISTQVRQLHPDLADDDIYFCFLQDDLVIGACSLELTSEAQNLLMDLLGSYSFQVNRAKSLPASDSLEFCGYLISRGMVTPTATRKSVTLAFADAAWTTYLKLKPQARLKWFYSIAGTFHFSRPFLDGNCALNLRVIYDHIQLLNQDPLATFDAGVVKTALFELVAFLNLGLPPSILFHFPKVYATILVTDANIKAWSAQLFYIVDAPDSNKNLISVLPDLADLMTRLTSAQNFPAIDVPVTAILVPVRMAADVFTDREQVTSSTTRERYAQLASVDELFPLFQGPVVLINDNQNSLKNWHEVDRLFTGRKADQFNRFLQHVHAVAWMPRDSNLATLVDELARLRETLVTTALDRTVNKSDAVVAALSAPAQTADDGTPSNPTMEIIPLLPSVPVAEHHPMDAVVLSHMSEQFHAHYLTDHSQKHFDVDMADICRHLLHPEEPVSHALTRAAKSFKVMNGMVFWQHRGSSRLYVPKFSYTGALAGNETMSSHTYLVMLTHFGHGAHASPGRMEADLKRTFWWPHLKQDTIQFANACTLCRHLRATHDANRGGLGSPTEEADRPFRVWLMDFAEAPDRRGYILLFICAFSGYVITRKCNSSTHHHVLDTLWDQIILVHGVPQRVHCDQGTHFTAEPVRRLASNFGIRITFGPAAHPRAQGMVEKAIGDVKKAYETVVETHVGIAPARALLIAVWQHNTHLHSRLGFTPYEIVHGFRNRSLLDLTLPRGVERHLTEREQEWREIVHALVQLRREDARAVYQARHLASSHPSNIKVGDLVYKYTRAPVPGGYRTDCKGIYYVVRPASSTTWFISAEEWSPGRIWTSQDREAQYAVPELQLRRLGDVGDYAGRVFQPPPVPAHLTRQDHLGSHPLNETPTQPSSVPRYSLRNIARRGDHQSV